MIVFYSLCLCLPFFFHIERIPQVFHIPCQRQGGCLHITKHVSNHFKTILID